MYPYISQLIRYPFGETIATVQSIFYWMHHLILHHADIDKIKLFDVKVLNLPLRNNIRRYQYHCNIFLECEKCISVRNSSLCGSGLYCIECYLFSIFCSCVTFCVLLL